MTRLHVKLLYKAMYSLEVVTLQLPGRNQGSRLRPAGLAAE